MHSFGPMNLAARQRVGIRLLESGIRPRSSVNTGIVASEANGTSTGRTPSKKPLKSTVTLAEQAMASQNEYLKDSSIDGGLANHEASDALKAILERRRQQKPSSSLSSRGRPVTEPSAMPRLNTFLPETQLKRTSKVKFWLHHHTVWGQSLKLVGASPELGNWVLSSGINMTWSEGDNWHCTVELPAGGVFEYKFVVVDHNSQTAVAWQSGNNSVLALRHADDFVEVFDNWHCSPGAKLVADGGAAVTRENRLLSWASEIEAQLTSQRQELRRARMELTAAQEEARLARSDAARARAALSESEAHELKL